MACLEVQQVQQLPAPVSFLPLCALPADPCLQPLDCEVTGTLTHMCNWYPFSSPPSVCFWQMVEAHMERFTGPAAHSDVLYTNLGEGEWAAWLAGFFALLVI